MKKAVILIAVIFCLASAAYTQDFRSNKEKYTIPKADKALKMGETLNYRMEWLGVPMGNITLKIEGIKKINGRDCYHITARAVPNRFFAKLYDVEYIVHTYIDVQTFNTMRFEKTRRMKKDFNYVEIDFDWEKQEARYKTQGSAYTIELSKARSEILSDTPNTLKIMNGVQDLFSSFYCLRLMDLEEGKAYKLMVYYDQKHWQLDIKPEEPFLRDIRDKGSFVVFGVSINSKLNEYVLGRRDIHVYLTADTRRIPIEFKFHTGIGLIRGKIRNPL